MQRGFEKLADDWVTIVRPFEAVGAVQALSVRRLQPAFQIKGLWSDEEESDDNEVGSGGDRESIGARFHCFVSATEQIVMTDLVLRGRYVVGDSLPAGAAWEIAQIPVITDSGARRGIALVLRKPFAGSQTRAYGA